MNRSLQIRGGLVLVVLLLSVIGLIPTFQAASISEEERERAKDDPDLKAKHDAIEDKAIRRGLDLQGGMYLVYEVDQEGMSPEQARDALNRVREIIGNRIDQFGVSEPIIQTQGTNRIIVQLPGIQDPERAKSLLGQTAQLEFRLVRPVEDFEQAIRKLDAAFVKAEAAGAEDPGEGEGEDEPAVPDEAESEVAAAETAVAEAESAGADDPFGELAPPAPSVEGLGEEDPYVKEHPFSAFIYFDPNVVQSYGTPLFVDENNVTKVQRMLDAPEARAIGRDAVFQFDRNLISFQGGLQARPLYLLEAKPGLTGDRLTVARARPDPDRPGFFQVNMKLDRRGARVFSKLSGENIGRHLAISLDRRVASAPAFRTKIPSGDAVITGSFTNQEASDLALLLRAGALPADVRIEEERTVGPSLGRDSIQKGVRAALYGSLLVILFIFIYYRASGLVAVAALISNVVILLAVLAQFGLVLTLPGIAGILLTVGMAVDANVLINERIREELRKDKTIRAAVDSGYKNATRTIVDANVTTLIAALILLWFGTGPIKGFAVTLSIGILSSMFTALVMTRVIMQLATRKKGHVKVRI